MVVFDSTFLIRFFTPEVGHLPLVPGTQEPVDRIDERMGFLVKNLAQSGDKIVVPTPALSELLAGAGEAADEYLGILRRQAVFQIEPYGVRAAIENAAIMRSFASRGDKRGGSTAPWVKITFDRQIMAIAKVSDAEAVYSDDSDLYKLGQALGMQVIRTVDLSLPPEAAQGRLKLDDDQPE
jgi:predicted nucleic acid-binding protein